MSSSKTLIVFDCDGTLVDSQHLIVEAMRRAFVAAGFPSPERADILRIVGLSLPEALSFLAPDCSPEARIEIARTYREWCLTLRQEPSMQEPLFEGAAPLLLKLASQENVCLGLATGKSRRGVSRFIEQNGLQGIFATIQTADNAPSKPHPAMLLQAMQETGTSPQQTKMIGDTSYDMIMAACANVAGIGVTWGYHSMADLKKAGAKTIVHNFSTLALVLNAIAPFATQFEAVA